MEEDKIGVESLLEKAIAAGAGEGNKWRDVRAEDTEKLKTLEISNFDASGFMLQFKSLSETMRGLIEQSTYDLVDLSSKISSDQNNEGFKLFLNTGLEIVERYQRPKTLCIELARVLQFCRNLLIVDAIAISRLYEQMRLARKLKTERDAACGELWARETEFNKSESAMKALEDKNSELTKKLEDAEKKIAEIESKPPVEKVIVREVEAPEAEPEERKEAEPNCQKAPIKIPSSDLKKLKERTVIQRKVIDELKKNKEESGEYSIVPVILAKRENIPTASINGYLNHFERRSERVPAPVRNGFAAKVYVTERSFEEWEKKLSEIESGLNQLARGSPRASVGE